MDSSKEAGSVETHKIVDSKEIQSVVEALKNAKEAIESLSAKLASAQEESKSLSAALCSYWAALERCWRRPS